MNNQFCLRSHILKSNHNDYKENKNKNIYIQKLIGEGVYGIVFLIQNDHVIKIFKNSTLKKTILEETNYLIPIKNENRELMFYYKYINDNKESNNYIINLYAIGIIKDQMIDNNNLLDTDSYFIILPYCMPFYKKFNVFNKRLIDDSNGIKFTLRTMKKISEASLYLENKYNLINLDIKLNNCMITRKDDNIGDIIMIDFSIIKKKCNKKYTINTKYYIWPNENINIEYIPSYSISINGLELLFGHEEIINFLNNDNKITKYLKIIKDKNKNLYNIFYQGLIKKIDTESFIKLIKNILLI
jgi:serine/threonine protein kinase